MRVQCRQPALDDRGAERVAALAGGERDVDHVGRRVVDAAVRVERMLERRHHQHAGIALEDVLGAVAVVDVEVDDRDAFEAVRLEGVRGADGDVVEEAEAHRAAALGVVPGRPHGAERGRALLLQHEVDAEHDGAGGVACRGQRVRVERGVRVEVVQSLLGARGLDLEHVGAVVDARDLIVAGGGRRVVAQVLVDPRGDHAVADRHQPLRTLGVVRAHLVEQRRRVGDERGGHGARGRKRTCRVGSGCGYRPGTSPRGHRPWCRALAARTRVSARRSLPCARRS